MTAPLEAVHWIHGAPDCAKNTDPLLQVHRFDRDTFIMRENKCLNYEGNFLYLLFGETRVILFDTGAGPENRAHGGILPLRATVDKIIEDWKRERGSAGLDMIVAHTHSHADHVFWDSQFQDRPRTTIVGRALSDVKAFFHLPNWPEGETQLELGGRPLTIFPLPGHETAHIAVYDARDGILLTGDTLYPGLLTVQDWPAFRLSAARLARFAEQHPVSFVLGDHIEMKKAAGELYPIGTTFQPDEHALPVTAAQIRESHAACEAMATSPHYDVHNDFIIGAGLP